MFKIRIARITFVVIMLVVSCSSCDKRVEIINPPELQSIQDPPRAIQAIKISATLPQPKKAEVTDLYNKGSEYMREMRWNHAERAFLDALDISPDIPAIYHSLGLTYVQMQDYESAIHYFEEAIQRSPQEFKGYYALAKAQVAVRDFEAAEMLFEKVIELQPMHRSVYHDLAGMYYSQQRWDEVIQTLRRAQDLGIRSTQTLILLGVAAISGGRMDIALDVITQLRNEGQYDSARRLEAMSVRQNHS